MIFDHGLYHADPHPGNLLVLPGGVIGLLDFGMVGRISDSLREDLEDMLIAIVADDPPELTAALLRIGVSPSILDEDAFSADIADFVDHYGQMDIDHFDLAGALTELFRLVRRHGISLTPQLAMLLKLLVMLEGTAKRLSPQFSLVELLGPMQRRMILRRLNPMRQAKKVRRLFGEVEQLAEEMPRRLRTRALGEPPGPGHADQLADSRRRPHGAKRRVADLRRLDARGARLRLQRPLGATAAAGDQQVGLARFSLIKTASAGREGVPAGRGCIDASAAGP
jgi:ubiquinone biosynthesis protein